MCTGKGSLSNSSRMMTRRPPPCGLHLVRHDASDPGACDRRLTAASDVLTVISSEWAPRFQRRPPQTSRCAARRSHRPQCSRGRLGRAASSDALGPRDIRGWRRPRPGPSRCRVAIMAAAMRAARCGWRYRCCSRPGPERDRSAKGARRYWDRLLEFAGQRQQMEMAEPPRRGHREIARRSAILARGLFLGIVDLFDDALAGLDIGSPGVGERQPAGTISETIASSGALRVPRACG